MRSFYINSVSTITAQPEDFLTSDEVLEPQGNILKTSVRNYKELIKPMMLRRMSKAVKMGIFSAVQALSRSGIKSPDAILVGTGQGCMQDTEKFMQQIEESEEQLLTPSSFIQSTHNTVSGQIALFLKCTGYNMTYTQNSISFESCLLDAQMQFELDPEIQKVIVGAVDETSEKFTGFQKLDGQIKEEEITITQLLESNTPGTIISESSAFFSISREKSSGSLAICNAVKILNDLQTDEIEEKVIDFLQENELTFEQIDAIVLGNNGDNRFDTYYQNLQRGLFSNVPQLGYKSLTGDNNSISAIGCALGVSILQHQQIPKKFRLNSKSTSTFNRILVYNQYLGRSHGFILLESLEI
ncbi:3-oxoacyl-(acyl-carrier-protein) synthase [Gramella sp. Hel_I_59]|uniref:beta-ketoacyl synthase chain length factor n=1 Tax=Gramella sp. Hel_I_59 TaxID=1249978 RepID=UPI001152DF1A|nr:beta-ketoacyl synthase chain length factor [Gramella sp. Hel_I_59]TQI70740.1 3-oxoacyl-(acyl-carrier-protein) synthase [Gramella sp. Hel_I_59]